MPAFFPKPVPPERRATAHRDEKTQNNIDALQGNEVEGPSTLVTEEN